jgi:hypothetical protein
MVVRQMFGGVLGGTSLALLALFLTVPRAVIEEEAPPWLLTLFPDLASSRATVEPESERETLVPLDDARLEERPLIDEQIGSEGSRVASLRGPGSEEERELVDPDPEEGSVEIPTEPSSEALDPNLYLGALSKQTVIRLRPDLDATVIGFARTGALLRRAAVPTSHKGCKGGWYRVEPNGYICVGNAATLDTEHPIIRLASVQPDRSLPLPYPYGESRYPTPPLYTRIPTKEQQSQAEQDLTGHLKKNFGAVWDSLADNPPPEGLAAGQMIPRPFGYPILEQDFMTGRALGKSSFAFMDLFESGGRSWGLTTDMSLLPLDRLIPVEASTFSGVTLQDAEDLPVVFVRSRVQHLYEGSAVEGTLRPTRPIKYREAFHLTGQEVALHGTRFFETRDGTYLKEHSSHIRVQARKVLPKWAKNDRSWLEVSILNQTLIAYRGEVPIFATLVSTGRDGLGDPEKTFSTAQGVFLIHTKHVTSTMSGDEADDEFDLRDVPYVQYFQAGFALHAAFWHDTFGQPRSHGCVNLSPADARQLFNLTEPAVPLPWHSALDTHGTLVYVHP